MEAQGRLVTAGRVGRSHGLDGSFHVLRPEHGLAVGTLVTVAGVERRIRRRAGTDDRPLVAVEGIDSREAAREIGGELLLVAESELPLGEGEWLVAELIGCEVPGLGKVERVIGGSSCDVLELTGGTLVPLVTDAVLSVDIEARRIEIDREFLRLDGES